MALEIVRIIKRDEIMSGKSSVSNAHSYQEIGEFWDAHDATEFGDHEPIEFDVNISSQRHYFAVDGQLCSKIRQLANQRGISEETLVNIFLRERINELERNQEA